jgi:hypothetical protein
VKDRLFTLTKVKWQSLSLKDLECADRQLEKALKNYEGKLEVSITIVAELVCRLTSMTEGGKDSKVYKGSQRYKGR